MYDYFVIALQTINELLTAGIAITAFSLLLYALSFNLRDRVARSFAIILLCVVVVYVAEALAGVAMDDQQLEFWLRLQWVGIVFLPAAYLHFSDALLATTGRPSRGRRRLAVRMAYGLSLILLVSLPFSILVGPLVSNARPAPYLERTTFSWVFTGLYILAMLVSWVNFSRAYRRTVASTSRRRMFYLITGALAPALGSFPYLLFGNQFAAAHPLIFWFTVTVSNILISGLLVLMAYAVAFFGVPWPDRVVKRRLLKWLMRGPVTASTVLAITTLIKRAGSPLHLDVSALVPAATAGLILIIEHLITLVAPVWERWLFLGKEQKEMQLLQTLDERLLTTGDMRQLLEAILAAVSDRLQAARAFIASIGTQGMDMLVSIGSEPVLENDEVSANLLEAVSSNGLSQDGFFWGDYWLVPLYETDSDARTLIGLLGVIRQPELTLDEEQLADLEILTERAAMALRDRHRQQQAFNSLQELTPQMDLLQRLRASAQFDRSEILAQPASPLMQDDFSSWVKDALTHFWGGPKLTQNPLLNLRVVQLAAEENEDNPTNALRTVLRKAIDRIKPEGERRFTAEWILYNILELKFMEGRKVREIAMRLAMSEADLYRKQRVAIEAVAEAIKEMEQQAMGGQAVLENNTNQATDEKGGLNGNKKNIV